MFCLLFCFFCLLLVCDFNRLCECFLVELPWSDMYRLFHELGTAPALEQQAEVLGVFCRHLEGLVHFARLVEIGEVDSRVVPIVPTALEHYPAVVGREGRIAFGQRAVEWRTFYK